MCKKWRFCVYLLACAFFISSMLFLDTLVVNAAIADMEATASSSSSVTITVAEDGGYYVQSQDGRVFSTFIRSQTGGTFHFEIPCSVLGNWSGDVILGRTRSCTSYLTSFSASQGTVSNLCLKDDNGTLLSSGLNPSLDSANWKGVPEYELYSATGKLSHHYLISFDYALPSNHTYTSYTITFSYGVRLYVSTFNINDAQDSIVGHLKDIESDNETIIEQNNDAQTTREGIASSLTDFFGSFFSNLIGVFVPESNYFSNWFTRVNDLLADKLGILYFPFDFIIDTLTTINSNSSSFSGQIIFPEMSFTNSATSETYILLNRQVIDLNDYDVPFTSSENSSLVGTTNFTSLLSIIRLFTGIAFTLALVHLFIDKLHLILRGSERG